MHCPSLHRARADESDLHGQVIETPWLEPRQGADLGPALHLEDTDAVTAAQHVVDPGLITRDRRQGPRASAVPGDEIEGNTQCREHSQPQQVELHQPHPGTVLLIPLQHRATRHPGWLDRTDAFHWFLGQHHSGRVDAQVTR